jgi:N4-gp56 family major capsid protein
MAITSHSTLSSDAATFIRDELLSIAEVNIVFGQHALMADLPQHNSKTCQFSRYPRLALPMTPVATEGTTPDSVALAVETVQAVVDQWILVVALTDLSQITIKHPLVPIVTQRLGEVQAELVDREIQAVLNDGTNVSYSQAGGAVTVRSSLATTSAMDATTLRSVWALLSRQGARQMGVNYVLIVDPEVAQEIAAQSTFISAHTFQDVKAIYNNVIGNYLGFDVEVSNFIPKIVLGSTSWTVATTTLGVFGNAADLTSVKIVLESIDTISGQVVAVSAAKGTSLTSTAGTDHAVLVSVPTSTAFLYNVYVANADNVTGTAIASFFRSNTATYTGLAGGSTLVVTAFVTSGLNAHLLPPASVTVHQSYAIGKEAFGMVKLSGDNLRVLMTDGKPSDSDPAAQRRKISLKGSFKAVVLNSSFYRRIETGSA